MNTDNLTISQLTELYYNTPNRKLAEMLEISLPGLQKLIKSLGIPYKSEVKANGKINIMAEQIKRNSL
jgi:hypothetical protein